MNPLLKLNIISIAAYAVASWCFYKVGGLYLCFGVLMFGFAQNIEQRIRRIELVKTVWKILKEGIEK